MTCYWPIYRAFEIILKMYVGNDYTHKMYNDRSWRNEVQPTGIINMTSHPPRYPSTSATKLREKYTQYFIEDAVP